MARYHRPEAYGGAGLDDLNYGDIVEDVDLELDELERKPLEPDPAPASSGSVVPPPPTMRLVPRLGRTVHVSRNVDVARSFRLLNAQVSQNKVRRQAQLQREHERPGLKRKRLKCERWRARFKRGFKATVNRVTELTKQGW